jgi:CRISPR-associated endonuclease Csy4
MDRYVDLTLLPDPEIAQPHLMGALFGKLHGALVMQRSESIGISFPAVQAKRVWLGDCLRLHGDHAALTRLMTSNWLAGLRDHVQATESHSVPPNALFRVVSRVQAKSNPERLRRRQMRRHGLDVAQALANVPDSTAERLALPYVQLRSQSTVQCFRLFIRHGDLVETQARGSFSAYGLSPTATIPWF